MYGEYLQNYLSRRMLSPHNMKINPISMTDKRLTRTKFTVKKKT